MTEWENKPKAIKDSFNKAMTYFEGLVRDYKVYKQNSGGTAIKHSFESANQATEANRGDKLWQYIAGITKAVVAQEEQAANIHNSAKVMMDAMTTQTKAMSNQIAQITRAIANKENSPNGGSGGNSSSRNKGQARCEDVQYDKPCTMGSYCLSQGFHPAGVNTRAPPAQGDLSTTTPRPLGTIERAAASTSQIPSALALSSRAMQPTQASQRQPTDRDQDKKIGKGKRTVAKQQH
jgi:hypothetical protein